VNADEIVTGLPDDQRLFLTSMTLSGPVFIQPDNEQVASHLAQLGLVHMRDGEAELSELGQEVASLVDLQEED
jgi:hypothetical protein